MKLPQLQRTSGSGEARAGPHLWRLLIGFRLDNLGIASKSPWAPTNNFLWVEPLESPRAANRFFGFAMMNGRFAFLRQVIQRPSLPDRENTCELRTSQGVKVSRCQEWRMENGQCEVRKEEGGARRIKKRWIRGVIEGGLKGSPPASRQRNTTTRSPLGHK